MPASDGEFAVPYLLPIAVIWSRPERSLLSTFALLELERLKSCIELKAGEFLQWLHTPQIRHDISVGMYFVHILVGAEVAM
jgi:hypothetical protein